ncbi:Phosphotransferase enzyme family protein [Corynebacterium humireducens NBRC 106098 = DSM 45392]|uniref:Phosphotransferase enzyme family protein n=1 Tax=Corynebacterium humireducens NBRC 106098 = DSM 45392 TaxID=1223515 RepID=A0A0B5D312_9CORY|nr:phosphotransferase [Corynebacterium humireducens]AJE33305.1 Phosphotransferase enzyme family protein [Corynebacterium humireducens NBRC 106098 = DSM 45392]
MLKPADIVDIAEDLLSRRFGGTQQLTDVTQLSGSGSAVVLRARVASSPFLQQRSVILKFVPETGDRLDDAALVREIVSYQFTTSLSEEVRPGPVLLAYDVTQRIIVLTDSGDGDTFADLLELEDPERRVSILRNLGTALGRMHAGTAEREQDFNILFTRMLRNHPESSEIQKLRDAALIQSIQIGEELLRSAGIEIPDLVSQFAADGRNRLLSAHHRAFTPFDLSPDNIIVSETTHFLDYEWAGFRDVSFDLACVIAGFPQFLFSHPISDDEADVFVDAWSHEVDRLWPNVKNEAHLHSRIMAALLGWALSSVALLHFGSMSAAVAVLHEAEEQDQHIDPNTVEGVTDLLRPASHGPFTAEEIVVRRDIFETFEALARYAARGTDPSYGVIAAFSQGIADRVAEPGLPVR